MKLEILMGKSRKYYWRVRAKNGKIVCHSETYSSKAKALQTAKSILKERFC